MQSPHNLTLKFYFIFTHAKTGQNPRPGIDTSQSDVTTIIQKQKNAASLKTQHFFNQ